MKEVLGERTAVTKDDLEKLQYTEQVLLCSTILHLVGSSTVAMYADDP